jgi:methylenetetrahydrofolate dehydrogenase (NADP+)/methenyltetrahydrofolate cyclohydrolase
MIIDGKSISGDIKHALAAEVREPKVLGVLGIGLDTVSRAYIRRKEAFARDIGCGLELVDLDADVTTEYAIAQLERLSAMVDAVIVQLPIPAHIDRDQLLSHIPPHQDVDSLTEHSPFVSPIVQAVFHAIGRALHADDYVVVVGKGILVGQPIIHTLESLEIPFDAFDKLDERDSIVQSLQKATIVVSGTGVPHGITPDMISDSSIIIDVGTSYLDGVLAGDFHPLCATKAERFTPTPGGIGPLVVAYLWSNVVQGI